MRLFKRKRKGFKGPAPPDFRFPYRWLALVPVTAVVVFAVSNIHGKIVKETRDSFLRDFAFALANKDAEAAARLVITPPDYTLGPRLVTSAMGPDWSYGEFRAAYDKAVGEMIETIEERAPGYRAPSPGVIRIVSLQLDPPFDLAGPNSPKTVAYAYMVKEVLFEVDAAYRMRVTEFVYYYSKRKFRVASIPRLVVEAIPPEARQ